jgi:cholesterol transport system auxiliary component
LVTVTVTAPQWLQNENIRYRQPYADPTRVGFYTQDRWLAAPAAMLAQRLTLFNGKPGWRLKITLLEFEQVFETPQTARMILVFRATAQSPSSEDIAADTVFNLSMPAASADAQGAVSAAALLVAEAVNALQKWFAAVSN